MSPGPGALTFEDDMNSNEQHEQLATPEDQYRQRQAYADAHEARVRPPLSPETLDWAKQTVSRWKQAASCFPASTIAPGGTISPRVDSQYCRELLGLLRRNLDALRSENIPGTVCRLESALDLVGMVEKELS